HGTPETTAPVQLRSPRRPVHRILGIIAHFPDRIISPVKSALLFEIQRPGPNAAEDRDLVAGFIDRSIAIKALGDGNRLAAGREGISGNQLRNRSGTKAVVTRRLR